MKVECKKVEWALDFLLLFSRLFSFCSFLWPSPWLACRDIWTLWNLGHPVRPPEVHPSGLWLLLGTSSRLLFLFHRRHRGFLGPLLLFCWSSRSPLATDAGAAILNHRRRLGIKTIGVLHWRMLPLVALTLAALSWHTTVYSNFIKLIWYIFSLLLSLFFCVCVSPLCLIC